MNAVRVVVLLLVCSVVVSFAAETNTLPTTITVDGFTYSNVTWRTVTPVTVSIMHATGAASIPLEKLPPELQKRFGYDPDRAGKYFAAKVQMEAQRQRQDRIRNLRARFLRNIGGKLYDLTSVQQLLTQEQALRWNDWVNGGDKQWPEVCGKIRAWSSACVVGEIAAVQDTRLLIHCKTSFDYYIEGSFDNAHKLLEIQMGEGHSYSEELSKKKMDESLQDSMYPTVYLLNYPEAGKLLAGQQLSAAALWTGNRDGKRVYDCGSVPTDDELLSLPIKQIEVK